MKGGQAEVETVKSECDVPEGCGGNKESVYNERTLNVSTQARLGIPGLCQIVVRTTGYCRVTTSARIPHEYAMPFTWSFLPMAASFMAFAAKYSRGRHRAHLSLDGSITTSVFFARMVRSISYIHGKKFPVARTNSVHRGVYKYDSDSARSSEWAAFYPTERCTPCKSVPACKVTTFVLAGTVPTWKGDEAESTKGQDRERFP
jgi:hypothetical protein